MEDVEAAVIAGRRGHVRACQLADQRPRPADSLPCYLHRALNGTVCDGELRLSHEWREHQRARHRRTGELTACLKSRGGFCDCEVLMNVYPDRRPDLTAGRGRCSHPARH